MDKTSAFSVSYKISGTEITNIIPFTFTTLSIVQRVQKLDLVQIVFRYIAEASKHSGIKPRPTKHVFGQIVRQNKALTNACPAFFRTPNNLVQTV